MPSYRFNLEDHQVIADRGLHECADENDAQMMANEIADRLVQHQPEFLDGGYAIVVRDQENRQVYRAEMDRSSILQRRTDGVETVWSGCSAYSAAESHTTVCLEAFGGKWEMQDLKKHGYQDRSKINMHEAHEVQCWTKHLEVSKEQLQKAVDKVGNSAAAVKKELAV
jgi:hypothetical protein